MLSLRRLVVAVLAVVVPFTGLELLGSPAAALPVPPSPPAAVTPTPWYSAVTTPGPTNVSGNLTADTVWGPQGSPYIVTSSLRVTEQVSLTMLPGTVVKMAAGAKVYVNGQLLVLGEPGNRVTVTSLKDDSVLGDTNGDGPSVGTAGDWVQFAVDPGISQASLPPSVVDYATFKFGGGVGTGWCGNAMLDLNENSRIIVSNSRFTDSSGAGVTGTAGDAGFVGIYDSFFTRDTCGVSGMFGTADYVGNEFAGKFGNKAVWQMYSSGRFWFNDVRDDEVVFASSPFDVRFNTLKGVFGFGTWPEQLQEYTANWWGRKLPASPAIEHPQCMTLDEVNAYQPPILAEPDYVGCPVSALYRATQWRLHVVPSLEGPPGGLPEEMTRPYAASYGAVDTFRGELTYRATDLVVTDAGETLEANRVYQQHTLNKINEGGDLGPGWRMAYTDRVQDSLISLGDGGDVPMPPCEGDLTHSRDPGVAATCVTADGEVRVTTSEGVTYIFGMADGLLRKMLLGDPGHVVTVTNIAGRLSQVTGESGRALHYFRSSNGLVTSISDSQGRSAGFGYDANGQLASVTGVDGQSETYAYTGGKLSKVTSATGVVKLEAGFDASGRVSWIKQDGQGRSDIAYVSGDTRTITQADGSVITQLLDQYGRLVSESVDGGPTSHLVYDGDGRLVASIPGVPRQPMTGYAPPASMIQFNATGDVVVSADGMGRLTRVAYNEFHRPTKVTTPDGGVATFTYGAQGRLTTMVDPRGKTWSVDNNGRGQIISVTDPVGRIQSWSYEPDGDLASETNELGGTTTYENSPEGWITAAVDPLARRTEYGYTPWGETRRTTSPRGGITTVTFDHDRRPTATTDPLGATTSFSYDTSGRLSGFTDALNHATTIGYDVMGRMTAVTDAANHTFTRSYYSEGWLKTTTGPGGDQTTIYYDPAGRETRVKDALGRITQTAYNRGNDIVRVDYPDGSSESYGYDKGGRQNKYTNPLGGTYTSTYDAGGNLLTLKDPLGNTEQRAYDGVGRLSQVTDALARAVDYSYADSGRTVTISDVLGMRSKATLDTAGQLIAEYDGEGAATTYGYNADGLVNLVTQPGNLSIQATYDLAGNQLTQTDAGGAVTSFAYDALGRVKSQTYPDGSQEAWQYDTLGNVSSHTNRLGRTWAYAYDSLSRLTSETDPLTKVTSYEYDAVDQVTKVTDPSGAFVRYGYDPMDRPAVISDNADAATVVTYDGAGHPLTVTDPLGRSVTYTYDTVGQRLSETYSGVLAKVTYKYDAVGNLTRLNQDVKNWDQQYDIRDRVSAVVDPTGKATSYAYDLADRVTKETLPSGRFTSYSYDAAGRLRTVADPGTITSTYSYRPTGELSQVKLPSGASYDFTYDAAGHLATQKDPLNKITSYTSDAEGQLLSTQLPSGKTITSTYDAVGRELTRAAGGVTRTFGYDAAGRLTSAATSSGATQTSSVTFGYNAQGQLTSSVDQAGTTTYLRDLAGQATKITPPSGTAMDVTYNAVGEVATVRGPVNLDYAYNGLGQLTSRTQALTTKNATVTFGYDNAARPKSVTANSSGSTVTYNDDGHVATNYLTLAGVTNPDEGTTTYTRDASGRLTGAQRKDFANVVKQTDTYQWDGNSNRTQISKQAAGQAAVTTDAVYDAAGRLVSSTTAGATTTYSYDVDGNLKTVDRPGSAQDVTYTYDGFGELASAQVTTPTTSTTMTYDHDAFGRVTKRAQTGSSPSTTTYGYRGADDDAATVTQAGATTKLWRDPTGELLSAVSSTGVVAHPFSNVHGDVVGWRAESNGALTSVNTYDPWGSWTRTAGPGTGPGAALGFGFQGDMTDAVTGLVDMNARSYDPGTGRFISQDDVIGDLTSPASLNRYGYGNASPVDFIDPTGHNAASFFKALACKSKMTLEQFGEWMSHQARSIWSSVVTSFQGSPLQGWWNNFSTWVRGQDTSTFHNIAMVVGVVPIIGDVVDVIDGLVYAAEGDYVNAAFSLVGAIPFIGSGLAFGLRAGYRAGKFAAKSGVKAGINGAQWTAKAAKAGWRAAGDAATAARRGAGAATDAVRTAGRGVRKAIADAPVGQSASRALERFTDSPFVQRRVREYRANPDRGSISLGGPAERGAAKNVTVYRVEGAANTRLSIGAGGDVAVHGDSMLYLNFGDEARALEYLAQKRAQPGMADAVLKSFEVPQSYADSLFARAVPQRGGAGAAIQQVDITRTDRSLGLASSEFSGLVCAIVPGSGRC